MTAEDCLVHVCASSGAASEFEPLPAEPTKRSLRARGILDFGRPCRRGFSSLVLGSISGQVRDCFYYGFGAEFRDQPVGDWTTWTGDCDRNRSMTHFLPSRPSVRGAIALTQTRLPALWHSQEVR